MNSVLHHVRKDLRHSRWLAAITWLAAAGILWLPLTPVAERTDLMPWLPLFRYGSWLLLFLTIGRIGQLDAPLRDTAFLRSRPVSQDTWLASKVAVSAIILLPMALLQVAMPLLAGMRPGFIDLVLIFGEEMLVHGVVAAFALALASRMESYPRFITVAMGLAFVAFIGFVAYLSLERWLTRETKPEWSYEIEYLKLSRLLIAQVAAVLGLLAGLFVTFRARRPERLTAAITGTVLATAFVWLFWPFNFVKTFTRPEAEAPLAERQDLSKISFSFVDGRFDGKRNSRFTWGFGGYNGVHYQHVSAFTRMEGLAPEWFAYPNGYCSSLRSPTGFTTQSEQQAWTGIEEAAILPSVGIPASRERDHGIHQVEVGDFLTSAVLAAGPDAVLEGVLHIPIKRPVVLARIPLQAGASARIGNRRITITKVESLRNDRISYQVIEERPMSRLRGGWHGEPHRRTGMIVINAVRQQFLKMQSAGASNESTPHYAVFRQDREDGLDPFKRLEDRTIPPDWLDGAELIITGDESGGTITHDFRFENVNLIETSWQP